MQPCVCNTTMHVYFNRFDCCGTVVCVGGVLWGLHLAIPFTTRKAKNLNKADADDEARAIKGVLFCSLTDYFLPADSFLDTEVCSCMYLLFALFYIYWGVGAYVNTHVCVYIQIVCGCGLWVAQAFRVYHQLGHLLCLCLINGLPLAELCTELRLVCSCRFCTDCTVNTQTTLWVPLTRTHTTTGAQMPLREYETTPDSNHTASH